MSKSISNLGTKHIPFKVSGMEEYLKKIADLGKNVDTVIAEAIHYSAQPIHDDISMWASRNSGVSGTTGTVKRGVLPAEVEQIGNEISQEIGVSGEAESWHAVFVEYGSPKQKADPGVRKAFESNLSKVKARQKKVLIEAGVPVDG